ncbi:MAG: hypothetical protein JXD19_10350 [Deltaproteobacteria bacterium]|nr:hypothetical protein [Deltaproteobacteria bacterium]
MDDFLGRVEKEVLRGHEIIRVDEETSIIDFFPEIFKEITGEWEPSLERILSATEDILGYYTPMSSPGKITLDGGKIRSFFWALVNCLRNRYNLPLFKEDLPPMAHMVAAGTYHHEYLHFFADIQRRLFPNCRYDHLREEALAVAYARIKICEEREKQNTRIGRLNRQVYQALLTEKFRYTAPGYRDWIAYPDRMIFGKGLADYIDPPEYRFLVASGVSVDVLLLSQLDEVYTFRVRQDIA